MYIFFTLITSLFALHIAPIWAISDTALLHEHKKQYELSPEQYCNKFGSVTPESRLTILLKKFTPDENFIGIENIFTQLKNDMASLILIQKNASQAWFWRDNQDQAIYNQTLVYIKNIQLLHDFFMVHKKYLELSELIHIYQNIPTSHDNLEIWIHAFICTHCKNKQEFPYKAFHACAAQYFEKINNISYHTRSLYPLLLGKIDLITTQLQSILHLIHDNYLEERIREQKKEKETLIATKLREEITNGQRIVKAQEDTARAAVKLVLEQERLVKTQEIENEHLHRIQNVLFELNAHPMNYFSTETLRNFRQKIEFLQKDISKNSHEKASAIKHLQILTDRLTDEIDLRELPQTIATLEKTQREILSQLHPTNELIKTVQDLIKNLLKKEKQQNSIKDQQLELLRYEIDQLKKEINRLKKKPNNSPSSPPVAQPVDDASDLPMAHAQIIPDQAQSLPSTHYDPKQ